jgi:hypothetical protein
MWYAYPLGVTLYLNSRTGISQPGVPRGKKPACQGHHKRTLVLPTEHGEKRNTYRILTGKPEGKRPRGRPRHR